MEELLRHFFVPRESNNHRAKILHHKSLLIIIGILFAASVFLPTIRQKFPDVLGISVNITTDTLLQLTNQKRQEQGVSALSLNSELSKAAEEKAKNMFAKDYWAHNAPDGTTPWVFIKGVGYNYVYAGENLARGFTTSEEAINAWMGSPSHRDNMLSKNYHDIGFAVETGKLNGEETVLIVEMLGSQNLSNLAEQNPQKSINENTTQKQTLNTQNSTPRSYVASLQRSPFLDSSLLTKNIGITILVLFILILIFDMILIERKKIVRLVGHNLDHVIFFGVILVLLFISRGLVL